MSKRKYASPRSAARTVEQAEFLTRKLAEEHGLPTDGLEQATQERGMAQSMARDDLLDVAVRDTHGRSREQRSDGSDLEMPSEGADVSVPEMSVASVCVCGHDRSRHPEGRGALESACMGTPGRGCACAGFTYEPRCDFCSGFPVAWSYPTRERAMNVREVGGPGVQTHVSHAGWAVCGTCAELIEDGDRRALSRRLPLFDLHPSDRGVMRAKVRQMHRIQFFDSRTGERERVNA